jgi:hypothetical protein
MALWLICLLQCGLFIPGVESELISLSFQIDRFEGEWAVLISQDRNGRWHERPVEKTWISDRAEEGDVLVCGIPVADPHSGRVERLIQLHKRWQGSQTPFYFKFITASALDPGGKGE